MTKFIDCLYGKHQILILLFVFFVFFCFPLFYYIESRGLDFFWDFNVYRDALDRFKELNDPYNTSSNLNFVYPPIFLYFLNIFSPFEEIVLIIFYLVAIYLLMCDKEMRVFCILIFSSFILIPTVKLSTYVAFATGNVTIFMHIVCIYLILKTKNWKMNNLLWIVVFIFSLIKIYFLSYLFLPLLVTSFKSQRLRLLVFSISIILVYLFQYFFLPDLFSGFLGALTEQTSSGEKAYSGDIGNGFYKFFLLLIGNKILAQIMHILLVVLLFFLIYVNRNQIRNISYNSLIYAGTMLAIISNPRLKAYDEIFIPVLFLLIIFKLLKNPIVNNVLIIKYFFTVCALSYFSFAIYVLFWFLELPHKGYIFLLNSPIITIFIPFFISISILIFQRNFFKLN